VIVFKLVAVEFADGEVFGLGMGEVSAPTSQLAKLVVMNRGGLFLKFILSIRIAILSISDSSEAWEDGPSTLNERAIA